MLRTLSRALDIVVAPAIIAALALAFFYAPPEKTMHDVYRIFYFHVPAAAASFLGFGIVFVCSVLYLRTRERRYDIVAGAAAEVGVLFCALGIGMGMLWAKPVWGAFWIPGDIHLLATAVLFLIYVAYLMMRGAIDDDERRARLSAVVGTFAIIAVPIVFFSIRVIHVGNHPVLTGLTPRMQFTFMFCMTVMMLFFTFILLRRVRLEFARAAVEDLRRDVLDLSERTTTGAARPALGRVVAGAAPAANPVPLGVPGAAFTANAVETRPRS
jgi:heme exporter protein C